tara:strand:+ start:158 stop:481 length:324 start_codon:yes stop_codon:yes gene_type:complete
MERSDLDFIREMLVTALNEKRDSIIGDLFKMYEEVQNRATIPDTSTIDKILSDTKTEYNFSLSSDYLDVSGFGNNAAAGAVDLNIPGAVGNDVISFGDYKSQEYRPE